MTSQPRKRLGRGLAALIGDDLSEEAVIETARGLNGLKMIAISDLAPNPRNPRHRFDEA
jgi:ParB family chromosome partitioning protein